jgi:hypothetical protein
MPRSPRSHPVAAGSLGRRVWTAGRWTLLLAVLFTTYIEILFASMRVAIKALELTVPDVQGKPIEESTENLDTIGFTDLHHPLRRADARVPANNEL